MKFYYLLSLELEFSIMSFCLQFFKFSTPTEMLNFIFTKVAWKSGYLIPHKKWSFSLTLFTMGVFGLCSHGELGACGGLGVGVGAQVPSLKISKTKNDLSMKLCLQKHVSFVSIVCLFSCLVCVTWCDYDVIYMTTHCELHKLDI